MHLKRQAATKRLPIPRKGTTYIARARNNPLNSVPISIAVRDILGLAKTTREVKQMIHHKLIKLNGRDVRNQKESVKLFNVLEVGKKYILKLLPTGKFTFEESLKADSRLCKIIGKSLFKGNKIQFNLHDGTNILSKDKMAIGDSVYIDFSGKLKKHVPVEKGKEAFVLSGKYIGNTGDISAVKEKKVLIKFKNKGGVTELPTSSIIVE